MLRRARLDKGITLEKMICLLLVFFTFLFFSFLLLFLFLLVDTKDSGGFPMKR